MREQHQIQASTTVDSSAGDRLYGATQWQLIWWQFTKHKLAVGSLVILGFFYLVAIFADFVSPHDPTKRFSQYIYAPPQRIRIVHEGKLRMPFVYGYKQSLDRKHSIEYIPLTKPRFIP